MLALSACQRTDVTERVDQDGAAPRSVAADGKSNDAPKAATGNDPGPTILVRQKSKFQPHVQRIESHGHVTATLRYPFFFTLLILNEANGSTPTPHGLTLEEATSIPRYRGVTYARNCRAPVLVKLTYLEATIDERQKAHRPTMATRRWGVCLCQ